MIAFNALLRSQTISAQGCSIAFDSLTCDDREFNFSVNDALDMFTFGAVNCQPKRVYGFQDAVVAFGALIGGNHV